jgi:hypothetical protein
LEKKISNGSFEILFFMENKKNVSVFTETIVFPFQGKNVFLG